LAKYNYPHRYPAVLLNFEGVKNPRAFAADDFEMALRAGLIPDINVSDVKLAFRGKNLACRCPLPERGKPDYCPVVRLLRIANED